MMISDCSHKHNTDENESQDEDKFEDKLSPQMLECPAFQTQISDMIFTLIPEVPRLRDLFISWEALSAEDKVIVEEYGNTKGPGLELYKPLLEALRNWNNIQDTQGAPGCDPGLVSLTGHPPIETALTNVVYTLECLVGKLQEEACKEHFSTITASHLSTSLRSMYDEDKDREGSTSDIGSCVIRRSQSLDDIPKSLEKKASVASL